MKKYISPCFLFLGVVTVGAAVFVGYLLVPYKVRETILEQSKIVDGNTRFENWEVIPVLLLQKIYFFNVTNPEEVATGQKPHLQEVGPYVYQQKRRKYDIVFNENGTIFYREKTDYFFRPDLSVGLESDWITFVNLPFLGTVHKASKLPAFTRYMITETLAKYPKEKLYVNVTIGNLMFGGRHLEFMQDLAELKGDKEILPNNTFALYYGKNGTDQGLFEIYSGVQHPDKFGDVITWNGHTSLDWWGEDQYCNQMNGTDGGIFQPFATRDRPFYLFVPGLCQSIKFTYDSDEEVLNVPTYKYSVQRSFFASRKENPDNACHCTDPGKDFENCPESGVTQLDGCGKGALMLSQPHFYQASDKYLNQSFGLNPQKDEHEMAIYLDPYTSVSVRLHVRFQMNVGLRPYKFFKPLKKIPEMVHPLFWIDQSVILPEEKVSIIRDQLHGTVNLVNLVTHIALIIGGVMIILSLLFFFLCSTDDGYREPEKVAGVSYQPQRTTSTEMITIPITSNGGPKHKFGPVARDEFPELKEETVPFLLQNGNVPKIEKMDQTSSQDRHPNDLTGSGHSFTEPVQVTTTSDNVEIPSIELNDTSKEPDSRLSPFPGDVDSSSTLSLGVNNVNIPNAVKDIVEVMSSYENF